MSRLPTASALYSISAIVVLIGVSFVLQACDKKSEETSITEEVTEEVTEEQEPEVTENSDAEVVEEEVIEPDEQE
tara:strand:+ start:1905 stop:2129 length:225 start_codon:yes stop_codon:yes gene_type:complete